MADRGESDFIIVMGVSGSGKTTIGRALAERLACAFYDADDYHSTANRQKMAAGTPLTDDDRAGWLAALVALIREGLEREEWGVLACSALKEGYRAMLQVDERRVVFVYLKGDFESIRARVEARHDHYMKASMLASQFETLEEPAEALTIDVTEAPEAIVEHIAAWLAARQALAQGMESRDKT